MSSGGRGGRVDYLAHLGDLVGRKSADLGVLADDAFILGEIDAERLVVGDVALDPLDVGGKLIQRLVRLGSCGAQLLALEGADLGNLPFDDKPAQSHRSLPDSPASAGEPMMH